MTAATERKSRVVPDYQAFLASLELYTVALAEASCKINRDQFWEKDTEHKNSYRITSRPVALEDDYFEIRSTLTLNVTGRKADLPLVRVVASFDLHFHSPKVSKECVGKFCESDVVLIVMPYFRELVTDVTARMYIPPIILPLSTKG